MVISLLQVFEQHEKQVKETEEYITQERERLKAFEADLKMQQEMMEDLRLELVSSMSCNMAIANYVASFYPFKNLYSRILGPVERTLATQRELVVGFDDVGVDVVLLGSQTDLKNHCVFFDLGSILLFLSWV